MKNILIYDNQIFDAEDANTYEESNKSELYGFIVGKKYNFKTLSLESKTPIDASYCIISIKDDKIYMKDDKCILSVKKNNSSRFIQLETIVAINKKADIFLKSINKKYLFDNEEVLMTNEELFNKIEEVDWWWQKK